MSESAISQDMQKQKCTKWVFSLTVAKFSLLVNFSPVIPTTCRALLPQDPALQLLAGSSRCCSQPWWVLGVHHHPLLLPSLPCARAAPEFAQPPHLSFSDLRRFSDSFIVPRQPTAHLSDKLCWLCPACVTGLKQTWKTKHCPKGEGEYPVPSKGRLTWFQAMRVSVILPFQLMDLAAWVGGLPDSWSTVRPEEEMLLTGRMQLMG